MVHGDRASRHASCGKCPKLKGQSRSRSQKLQNSSQAQIPLGSSRHVSTRSTCRATLVESRRACRAVLVQHANGEQAIVLACTSFVVFILLHKQILFVSSNEINYINVYFNKLVKNLHIITLYKLHNKLSCESRLSRSSCPVCRAVLFDKLDTAKMHGLDTSYVSSRDENWNFGFSNAHYACCQPVDCWHCTVLSDYRPGCYETKRYSTKTKNDLPAKIIRLNNCMY